ncbi:MAG: T9SS type A sorting domain-containing protein, partial [Candidatus Bipolaricaulia bacterium]
GIKPAPITGTGTPRMVLKNKDGVSVATSVTIETVRVFDLSGKLVLKVEEGFSNMTSLKNLQNGLYLYTVDVTLPDGSTDKSPVMKFIVRK